ncbi:hypothetical protein [Clostridium estertheticum]|uniref:hypothetical protein n=1 Tax=Clostridium estertheticum TaxID=238834 RepID=UPI001C7D4DA3|nr:hypothetical protein [Clostridium estertheticum]MBX4264416.1 hypothetical protein [Clostridium estertheticum]MBX4271357.1 hypothetical protein [Clostridium estertheticum]WLC78231.1 hypothetical protein KTC98_13405 [Clostridium estertheticum]WLC89257.1 hypothetical protein KTC95_03240 [Clostridium estertheticum]
MKDFLIMGLLVLIGGIILLSITSMFITRKIKIINPRIVYIILVLFPIILLVIPTALVSPIKGSFVENISLSIPRCIYSLEILLTLVVILIMVNMFPGSSFDDKKNIDYNFKKIATGIRLLQYSIFANILYIIPTLIFIIYAINSIYCTSTSGDHTFIELFTFLFAWGTLLLPSLAQVYVIAGICTISIISVAIILFITSVNGTIRVTSAVVKNKEIRIVYIISMGLPIINVVSMLFLCYMAKNKLQ